MRSDDEFVIGGIIGGIVLIVSAVVMLIIGGIVVADWRATKAYTPATCSGVALINLQIHNGAVASRATIETCVLTSNAAGANCSYTAELYFPPIDHYILAGKKEKDVNAWAGGLGGTQTFRCYIENPGMNGSRGVSATFEQIAGFIAMIVIAIIILVAAVIVGVVIYLKG